MKKILLTIPFIVLANYTHSQISFVGTDSGKETDPKNQEIYSNGGETVVYRITECEKGVHFTKQEIQNLKTKMSSLQSEMAELKNQINEFRGSKSPIAKTEINPNIPNVQRETSGQSLEGQAQTPSLENIKEYGAP